MLYRFSPAYIGSTTEHTICNYLHLTTYFPFSKHCLKSNKITESGIVQQSKLTFHIKENCKNINPKMTKLVKLKRRRKIKIRKRANDADNDDVDFSL